MVIKKVTEQHRFLIFVSDLLLGVCLCPSKIEILNKILIFER